MPTPVNFKLEEPSAAHIRVLLSFLHERFSLMLPLLPFSKFVHQDTLPVFKRFSVALRSHPTHVSGFHFRKYSNSTRPKPTMSNPGPLPPFAKETPPKFTESPNPNFTYGQKVHGTDYGKNWIEGEHAGWKTIDTATADPA